MHKIFPYKSPKLTGYNDKDNSYTFYLDYMPSLIKEYVYFSTFYDQKRVLTFKEYPHSNLNGTMPISDWVQNYIKVTRESHEKNFKIL